MFDFRYHALSLVAVFLALGIGIVLGSSLGDTVVSQANKDVRSSLRSDLVDAADDHERRPVAEARVEVRQFEPPREQVPLLADVLHRVRRE